MAIVFSGSFWFNQIPCQQSGEVRFFFTPYNFFVCSGAVLAGGQGEHLPTQFFRDQRQKISENCKTRATCKYIVPTVDVVKI